MTKEEAIEIINRENDPNDTAVWELFPEYREALDMAIKALLQEPKLTGICNECLKKNGCEMYSQLIKSGEKYTVKGCEKYISKPCILDRRVDKNTVVFRIIDGKEVEYIRKDTCEDAISREDAIKALQKVACYSAAIKARMVGAIEDLPPVTQKSGKWIPVSEKLPNDRNWYLGIFKEPDTGWINPLPFICDYVGRETKATTKEYWILRGFTDRDEHIDHYFNLECVAWMPLPKPYDPQEQERSGKK